MDVVSTETAGLGLLQSSNPTIMPLSFNSELQLYMGQLFVGTPKQGDSNNFGFIIDLNAEYTYVAGAGCVGCSQDFYDPALSSTS